jgi:hypothetical protein
LRGIASRAVAPGKRRHVLRGAGSADLFRVEYDSKGDYRR